VDASFPVIARFDLSGPWDGPVALSAFLGRPIVLFEHHEAVAAGIDLLSQAAATINSLGKVEWCGLQQMLRSNFITRRDGTTLHVKPYSSRIVFEIPTGITSLAVVPPNDDPKNGSFARVLVRGHNGSKASIRVSAGSSVPVTPGERIELVSPVLGRVDYRQVDPAGFPLGAFARRIICETRDRMLPLLPKKRDGGADVRAAE